MFSKDQRPVLATYDPLPRSLQIRTKTIPYMYIQWVDLYYETFTLFTSTFTGSLTNITHLTNHMQTYDIVSRIWFYAMRSKVSIAGYSSSLRNNRNWIRQVKKLLYIFYTRSKKNRNNKVTMYHPQHHHAYYRKRPQIWLTKLSAINDIIAALFWPIFMMFGYGTRTPIKTNRVKVISDARRFIPNKIKIYMQDFYLT